MALSVMDKVGRFSHVSTLAQTALHDDLRAEATPYRLQKTVQNSFV